MPSLAKAPVRPLVHACDYTFYPDEFVAEGLDEVELYGDEADEGDTRGEASASASSHPGPVEEGDHDEPVGHGGVVLGVVSSKLFEQCVIQGAVIFTSHRWALDLMFMV